MTFVQAPPSPNCHTTLDRFNVHRCPTRRIFSSTGIELVTRQATIRYLYHSAPRPQVQCRKQVFRKENIQCYCRMTTPTPLREPQHLKNFRKVTYILEKSTPLCFGTMYRIKSVVPSFLIGEM
ncbi:hypothetical protein TNCV_2650491 [Trichonephila clavipes]|nr:hypothetical protein TNCV_2650491 [Trichonephila clavipes]